MKHRILLALAATGLLGATAFGLYGIEGRAADSGETMIADVPGVPTAALNAEIDKLFSEDEFAETRALLIMRGGEIVVERYAPGYDRDTRFISWSMAKSVTAVLVGLMVADGRLALDAPAPVPDWQRPGDPRGAITLRHLLHMSSGLQHTEAGDPPYESDEVRMLFLDGRDNMVRYAEGQPLEAEPGSKFEYSTNSSVILSDIITRQLTDSKDPDTRRRAMLEYMRGRLIEPLGMNSMVPEFDASGTLIGGSIIQANARDWAKLGEFLRNKGSIAGNQFLTRGWVDFMLTSSPNDPAYGGHIWLNKPRAAGLKKVLYPDLLPGDVFAAQGHLGQFVIVSPSQKLTLVRLGKTQDDELDPVKEQLGRILALFPRD
ncbi:CubicO group peptidase (beta-lactamase class C family) [Blastomonas natatoria]|uniref:CubicO group peptidase (Beta-lactamase class C family) n=1 Tax=Blastomonas natatoria TaxID=34015 RepID=A0A2V3VCS3_9SPHN|nr:serine hydrolase [Blastomonas natatoria]PXW78568.1 CubicO group peptidase (beta-lactamase class C family) [Blastomonas natatoria]